MSIVIKSNNIAKNIVATEKMLGTTAHIEFNAYKARVVADGGIIQDEARCLKAFQFLFDQKLYGMLNTFISASFGLKIDGSNRISKAYALDGDDLVVATYGTGAKPLLQNSEILFDNNATNDATNGSILTTATQKVLSKAGVFGVAVKTNVISNNAATRFFAVTRHGDSVLTSAVFNLNLTTTNGAVTFQVGTTPFVTTGGTSSTRGINFISAGRIFVAIADAINAKQTMYLNGVKSDDVTANFIKEIATEPFYIDLGGMYQSNAKAFSRVSFKDFMSFSHISENQALSVANYSF
jgi:hypothetical protein